MRISYIFVDERLRGRWVVGLSVFFKEQSNILCKRILRRVFMMKWWTQVEGRKRELRCVFTQLVLVAGTQWIDSGCLFYNDSVSRGRTMTKSKEHYKTDIYRTTKHTPIHTRTHTHTHTHIHTHAYTHIYIFKERVYICIYIYIYIYINRDWLWIFLCIYTEYIYIYIYIYKR